MKSLGARIWMVSFSIMLLVASAISSPTLVNADEYKARIQNLQAVSQAEVATLSEQIEATKDDTDRAKLEAQVQQIKHDAEVQRLQILLEWAQADGDEARVAEVQTALNHWLNPPQPQQLPQVEREIPAPSTSPSNETTH